MLEIKQIRKSFGSKEVLKELSLTVNKGEFLTLLGPSGCGKTTLLRIIAGLERQNSGELLLAGEDISDLSPRKREFAIMFQSYALFPNLTAEQNVGFGLKSKSISKEEITRRVRDAFAMVHLSGEEKRYPSQLSGGMQQRVALARALVLRPKLLLLDEPLSALDAKVRDSLRRQIRMIQQELGITTIMVTHDQDEALTMSDRIAVMKDGVFEQISDPLTLYNAPQTPFVGDFIGTSNFFNAEVAELKSGLCSIRPENIMINDTESYGAKLHAVVELVEFNGATCRISCRSKIDEKLFLVDSPVEKVVKSGLTPGSYCVLTLNKHSIIEYGDRGYESIH